MANEHLKTTVLGILEEQLRMDDPKITGITLKRLEDNGHSTKKAKEMIAQVLLDEIYFVLNKGRPFDLSRYEKEMKKLK
ncbi:hypothetical protein [Alkalibacterium olivapovliticus]|uniref:Uncharacterized protein n=1 Tax=Alkalibacterium olivapovliticus TaxID=99907 RepID=A0A2T0WC90_9LACT|nr:hypothetical protein [Alkalibacterium olivapovliticus]PRY84266.1 hypothetical protein CLV38_101188 [Alkalibacterium olivapovliticus]